MEQKGLFDDFLDADAPRRSARKRASTFGGKTVTESTTESLDPPTAKPKPRASKKPAPPPTAVRANGDGKKLRPYPVVSFREATAVADAIFKFASGEKVRRLTLLEKIERNPNSSATRMLITNSGKYGITTGSYAAEFLELTELGAVACNPDTDKRVRLEAQFKLAVTGIAPFKLLYDTYVGKKLPAHEMMKDKLADSKLEVENPKECIDLFVVNAKDLGLLRTIASAETLVPIEQVMEEATEEQEPGLPASSGSSSSVDSSTKKPTGNKWQTTCFYISPIGEPGSESRRHSDLFLSMLVEPALKELGLEVKRADQIAEPGMITTHILEYLKLSRLVVADLSLLNPNVFYEMAIRHAVKLPIVQIIRKADRLPFDVSQVNSIIIDNTDIYTFTPKLETYRSEITTLARRALEDPEHVGNPISVFFPDFWK